MADGIEANRSRSITQSSDGANPQHSPMRYKLKLGGELESKVDA
jgi:hypothetical protein